MHRELYLKTTHTHTHTHNLNQTSPMGQQTDWASTERNIDDDLAQDREQKEIRRIKREGNNAGNEGGQVGQINP